MQWFLSLIRLHRTLKESVEKVCKRKCKRRTINFDSHSKTDQFEFLPPVEPSSYRLRLLVLVRADIRWALVVGNLIPYTDLS